MGLRIQASIPNAKGVIARLAKVKNVASDEIASAITEILEESIEVFQDYPPETAGNAPPPPYYQRTLGMTWDGETAIRGKESYDLRNTWGYNVNASDTGVNARIGSSAPYSGYVHATSDYETPQTVFHGGHGWPVAKDIIEERIEAEAPTILERIKNWFNRG